MMASRSGRLHCVFSRVATPVQCKKLDVLIVVVFMHVLRADAPHAEVARKRGLELILDALRPKLVANQHCKHVRFCDTVCSYVARHWATMQTHTARGEAMSPWEA